MKAEEFIGSEFVTPRAGVLKVVEIVGKTKSGNALFGCHCSICSLDKELYSELFISPASNLREGQVPCGCAAKPKYNEEQTKIRVIRKAKEKNITFHGWSNEYTTVIKTKCNLECDTCGYEWETTNINSLLNNNRGCPSCAKNGYDPSTPGTFYVVEWNNNNKTWIKYGITNRKPQSRFTEQKRNTSNTFKVLSLHYFDDGSIPPELERLVKPLKDKYPSGITKEQMPKGHTETLSIDAKEELYKTILPYKNNNKEK
ncbi:hypothetical protein [Aeromonas caviae]|uniref:hypothetical protein n=1 Tax=Aeromonas caviae TaxID=648 RepID=UPI002B4A6CAC|nr:hypothetical protein [Aeromonas caviae]